MAVGDHFQTKVVNAVRFYLGVGFSRGSGWLRRDHQSAGAVAPTAKLHNSVHVSRGSGMRRREHHGDGGHNNCVGPAGAHPAGISRRARKLAAAAAKPGLLHTGTDSRKRRERHHRNDRLQETREHIFKLHKRRAGPPGTGSAGRPGRELVTLAELPLAETGSCVEAKD